MGAGGSKADSADASPEGQHGEQRGPAAAEPGQPGFVLVAEDVAKGLRDEVLQERASEQEKDEPVTTAYHSGYQKGVEDAEGAAMIRRSQEAFGSTMGRVSENQLRSKVEEEAVQRRVDQLKKQKYSAPHREVDCLDERRATVECYSAREGVDTLECEPFVRAYSKCAESTLEGFVRAR